jgi:hypothetical protein
MYISLYICKYHVAQCVSMFITAGCVTVVKTVVKICKYHVAQCVSKFITAGCVTVVKTVVKSSSVCK